MVTFVVVEPLRNTTVVLVTALYPTLTVTPAIKRHSKLLSE